MPQAQTMSLEEKLAISNKALALWETGDTEGYRKLMKKLSIPPYLENVVCRKGVQRESGVGINKSKP